MTNELKPCPFCGEKACIEVFNGHMNFPKFRVECSTCEVNLRLKQTRDEAIEAWNTRQPAFNLKPIEELSRLSLTGVSTILLYSAERDFNIHDVCFVTDGTVLFVDNILGLYEVLETYTHYALLTPPERN